MIITKFEAVRYSDIYIRRERLLTVIVIVKNVVLIIDNDGLPDR